MADSSRRVTRRLVKLSLAVLPRRAGVALGHRLRGREERARARRAHALVLSHAKSGRTWLRVMLSRLFQVRHGLPADQLMEFDAWHRLDAAIPVLLYTHGHYLGGLFDDPAPTRGKPVVFLARHPCDVAVSQYFHSAKRTKRYKRDLEGVRADVSMFEFVMEGARGLPEIVDYLNAWERRLAGRENALVVSYEGLRERPHEVLGRVTAFLGLRFDPTEIAEAVAFGDFESLREKERTNFFRNARLAPRDPGDPDSFKVRRAKVGGYRDYFEPEQVQRLEAYVRERLATSYGYR